jgi:ABC-type glycerol-3-phosphate transport system substrate-binding protein
MNERFSFLRKSAFWVVVLVTLVYGISVVRHFHVTQGLGDDGEQTVLRISHSRLEPGYGEALDAVIADFVEYKARQGVAVKVEQLAVAGGFYEAWLNTQLVGGTAPDIVEQPPNKYQENGVYYSTYFRQLDELTNQPNPFNDFPRLREELGDLDLHRNAPELIKGQHPTLAEPLTVAEAIEQIDPTTREILRRQGHRATFSDGMLGGYNFSIAHYYRFILSASQRRIVYNQEMIEAATGSPHPPQTLDAFLAMCEKLEELENDEGKPIIPLAATRDIPEWVFHDVYRWAFFWAESYRLGGDLLFGLANGHWAEYQAGNWSFETPAVEAFYSFAREFSTHLTPGYQSLDRASSTFDFIQGRAAMRITETEEASSIFLQAKFPVGVMRFPFPAPGDRWYEYAPYPRREYNRATGQFSLSKQSTHPDLALEFMQFWTSRIWNERFNRFADLVPVIASAKPAERLEPFLPVEAGVLGIQGGLTFGHPSLPPEAIRIGEETRFLSGEIDYQTYAEKVDQAYGDRRYGIDRTVAISWDREWRNAKQADRNISTLAARELLLPSPEGINEHALNYMIFRNTIYANGNLNPYSYDRNHFGESPLPPLPRY